MTQDGHVYESEAIHEWFRRGHRTSPVTGAQLINLAVQPEIPLRRAIEEYMSLRPEIARRELNLRSDLLTLRSVTAALEEELEAKKRLLSNLSSEQRSRGSGASCLSTEISKARQDAEHSCQGVERGRAAADADRALPAVLANLPTPCRDGPRISKPSSHPANNSQSTPGRTSWLLKAMGWRGRGARRRQSSHDSMDS